MEDIVVPKPLGKNLPDRPKDTSPEVSPEEHKTPLRQTEAEPRRQMTGCGPGCLEEGEWPGMRAAQLHDQGVGGDSGTMVLLGLGLQVHPETSSTSCNLDLSSQNFRHGLQAAAESSRKFPKPGSVVFRAGLCA